MTKKYIIALSNDEPASLMQFISTGQHNAKAIDLLHESNSCIPKRKLSKQELTEPDKQRNRALAKVRIAIEHRIGRLKVFRMLKGPYRNRRRRLGLRLNLLRGLLNAELKLAAI